MIKGGLRELEKRLRDEPDNIGLRVTVAGGLREAGRLAEAVELYRSVAIAYRDQGRTMQAISVCRSILEISPLDARCKELLATLEAPRPSTPPPIPAAAKAKRDPLDDAPRRPAVLIEAVPHQSSSAGHLDETPLPRPLPYHVADPTQAMQKLEDSDLDTDPKVMALPARGSQQAVDRSASSSLHVDLSVELATRPRPRVTTAELDKIAPVDRDHGSGSGMLVDGGELEDAALMAPATTRMPRYDFDDDDDDDALPLPPVRAESPVGLDGVPRDTEDELTLPRDARFDLLDSSGPRPQVVDPLSTSFFTPMPVERRAAVLSRFHRRAPKPGDFMIEQGERNHPFIIVLRGELEVRAERGALYTIGPGEYAGEASLIARAPSAITVVATVDSQLLLLLPADFYDIVGGFPAVWAALRAGIRR